MKVVYLSYVSINGFGGANIEARKFYDVLKKYKSDEENFDFKVISLDENLPESFSGIKLKRFIDLDKIARLLGHSTYYYIFWKISKKKILSYKPDIVILGRSKFGFIAKDIKKRFNNIKVVTDVDNIEVDYVDAFYPNFHRLGTFKKRILKITVSSEEYKCLLNSNYLLFLTTRNKKRAEELYNISHIRNCILPICINQREFNHKNSHKRTICFYGSLDYQSNHKSVVWFIQNVWEPFFSQNSEIEFIIAGSKPRKELVEICDEIHNIVLYPDFAELEDFIPKNSLLVSPIIEGAGMKTKVAEALARGFLILGSDETMVGYEEIDFDSIEGVKIVNTPLEYKCEITNYLETSSSDLEVIGQNNQEIYKKYYSIDRAYNALKKIFAEIILY